MTQQSIEIVIGRLLTDEEFRQRFLRDPIEALSHLIDQGMRMTQSELAALVATETEFWARGAEAVDPRLQKINLKS